MDQQTGINILMMATTLINYIAIFIMFPRKYSAHVTIAVLAAFYVSFYVMLYTTDIITNLFGGWRGLVHIPLLALLTKGQFFQKIFGFFFSSSVMVVLLIFSTAATELIMEYKSDIGYLFSFILAMTLYCCYVVFLRLYGRRFFKKLFITGQLTEWGLYALGAFLSYGILVYASAAFSGVGRITVLIFTIWSMALLYFAIISTHEKAKQRYDAEFARDVISSGSDHYQKMNEMYDALRMLRHDNKYHLTAISELAKAGDTDGIEKYLAGVSVQISDNELHYYCQNSVFNALLSSYAERCERLNIKYDVHLAMPETLSVPNYEMCIVLGNLLENAVEACEKLRRGRRIELSVKTQGELLAVMVANSFDGEVIETDGQLKRMKKNGGFGLRSIRAVTGRYGGHMLTKWDDETFTVYVMLSK
jgi:hypothetical protein